MNFDSVHFYNWFSQYLSHTALDCSACICVQWDLYLTLSDGICRAGEESAHQADSRRSCQGGPGRGRHGWETSTSLFSGAKRSPQRTCVTLRDHLVLFDHQQSYEAFMSTWWQPFFPCLQSLAWRVAWVQTRQEPQRWTSLMERGARTSPWRRWPATPRIWGLMRTICLQVRICVAFCKTDDWESTLMLLTLSLLQCFYSNVFVI